MGILAPSCDVKYKWLCVPFSWTVNLNKVLVTTLDKQTSTNTSNRLYKFGLTEFVLTDGKNKRIHTEQQLRFATKSINSPKISSRNPLKTNRPMYSTLRRWRLSVSDSAHFPLTGMLTPLPPLTPTTHSWNTMEDKPTSGSWVMWRFCNETYVCDYVDGYILFHNLLNRDILDFFISF